MTKNWANECNVDRVVNSKQAKKTRAFVSVSEDFKTCVCEDVFYEDGKCKNAIGSNRWEFDIIKSGKDKKKLKKENKNKKYEYKSNLEVIDEKKEDEDESKD